MKKEGKRGPRGLRDRPTSSIPNHPPSPHVSGNLCLWSSLLREALCVKPDAPVREEPGFVGGLHCAQRKPTLWGWGEEYVPLPGSTTYCCLNNQLPLSEPWFSPDKADRPGFEKGPGQQLSRPGVGKHTCKSEACGVCARGLDWSVRCVDARPRERITALGIKALKMGKLKG